VRGYPAVPSDYGILYAPFPVVTPDSLRLAAWFFPAQDTAGIATHLVGRLVPMPDTLKVPPRPYPTRVPRLPTVVLCNGDAGNMTQNILHAYHLCTRGFHVVTFDWRGFGESDPWPRGTVMETDRLCYAEFLVDYAALLDSVRERPEVDPARVGLFGYSTGAYLSFATAASRPDVAAYAGRALLTTFGDILPLLEKIMPERAFVAPVDYPADLEPLRAAERVRCPAFLIVGEKDDRTPPWMTKAVADRVAGPCEVWIVPGATHGGGAGPEFTNYPEFFLRLAAFFRRSLRPG
jgi:pimeloyl-ACP methyl ester carboxylesterase